MTLQEIEAALRGEKVTLANGTDYWPYVYLADALRAERERIEAVVDKLHQYDDGTKPKRRRKACE